MVFISYSREDDEWRRRFLRIATPLTRYLNIEFWSDKNVKSGQDWRQEIQAAMKRSRIAVLLVSDNFLASDFIANEELPFFLSEAASQNVTILWVLLTPCLWDKTGLKHIQACCINTLKPLIDMSECGWREVLCDLVRRIDDLERMAETPVINAALNGRPLKQREEGLEVLAKPAIREVEVLVYSGDGKWYVQGRVPAGKTVADCWIGDNKNTKRGDVFKIIAITRDGPPLKTGSSHLNIPLHRSKSQEVRVQRI